MFKLVRGGFFVAAVLVVCTTHARAESIGPNCGTCQGSIYTLENLGMVGDIYAADGNLFDTYQFRLTIDATDYNGNEGKIAYIDEVAVKVASSANKATIIDAPGGASSWAVVPGGLNADGCSGSGSGFECADWKLTTLSAAVVPGTIWSWTFNIDVSSPLFGFTSTNPELLPSIKVRYVDASGTKVGALVSEKVPEPTTLGLMAVGLSLAALRRRRVAG
jgi:hypothetical protein